MTRSSFLCHCKLPKTHENTKHMVNVHLCGREALSHWQTTSCPVLFHSTQRMCSENAVCESWKCTGVSSVTECGCYVNNHTVCEHNRIKDSKTGLTTIFYCCVNMAIMFHPLVWRWGWCSWGHRQNSSSSKHAEMSWCQIARFWSHLTTKLSPSSPLNHSDVHWQTSDGPVHVLSWAGGFCRHCMISVLHGEVCYQLFSWWLWFQLPWDHWQDPPV